MPEAPAKFDLSGAIPVDQDESAVPSKFDLGGAIQLGSVEDLTTKPKGREKDGLYTMYGKKPTKDNPEAVGIVPIPYSRVQDALDAGYSWVGGSGETYTKDKAAEGKTPGLFGRIGAKVDSALQPVENPAPTPGLNPIQNTNQLRAAARTAMALPGYLGDLAQTAWGVAQGEKSPSDLIEMVDPAQLPEGMYRQFLKDWPKDHKLAIDNLVGTLAGTVAVGAVTHGAMDYKFPKSISEPVRSTMRDTLGIPEATEKTVEKFGKESEATRDANKVATEKTLGKRGQVDERRKVALEKHQNDLIDHAKKVEKLKADHAAAKLKRDLENEGIRQGHKNTVKDIHAQNENALKGHISEVERIAKDKQAAEGIENQRATLQNDVDTDSKDLFNRIDKAETKAKADDKAAWDVVRQKTAGKTTDISGLQKITEAAAEQADPATSSLFKRIIKGEKANLPPLKFTTQAIRYVDKNGNAFDRQSVSPARFDDMVYRGEITSEPVIETVNPDDPGYGDIYQRQFGEPPPLTGGPAEFDRLQRWYTYLNDKLYGGGRLEAGIYTAYKNVLKGIDDAMQDIARQAKAVPDLKNARKIHTERMEAFSDSPNKKTTAASKYEKTIAPEGIRDVNLEELGAKLSKYDPTIPDLGKRITQTRERLKSLPSEADTRKMLSQQVGEPPIPQLLPRHPELKPDVPEPEIPPPPEHPNLEEEHPYGEPETHEPLPEAPNIHTENMKLINSRLRQYGKVGAWVLRLIVGGVQESLSHGHLSLFSHDILLGQAGVTVLTHALRKPSVLDWLARPSEDDIRAIETLPPAEAVRMREALKALTQEEIKDNPAKGKVQIAPIMASFLAGQSIGHHNLQDIKKESERFKSQQAAPGPQSSNQGHTHVYDEESGRIVPV